MARRLLSSPKAIDPQGDALAILEFQSPTAALIATPVPQSARYVTLMVGVGLAACIAAACIIKTDKVVTAQGKLISTVPTTLVQPLETSIVRNIYVHAGQVVHKGDLLAELDPTFTAADLKADQEQVDSFSAQVERLNAQLANRPYVPSVINGQSAMQLASYNQLQSQYHAGVQNFDQQIASLQATYQQAVGDVQQYSQRLALAANVEAMRSQLQQMQVGSRLDSLAAADTRLSIAGNLADANAQARKAQGDIASIEAQREAFIQQWFSNLSQQLQVAGNSLATAQQSLTKDTKIHQLVDIRADRDAVVLTLAHVSVGSVLQSGQQFISLTPLNAPLQVDADLDGSVSGFVAPGNPVDIKLSSLPYTMYGDLKGKVTSISADSFDPADVGSGAVSDVNGTTPTSLFYRAHIEIDGNELHNLPPGFVLTPGMPVDADVKIGKRTIMEYLAKRVLPAFTSGMREPN
jgi:hemolysin D